MHTLRLHYQKLNLEKAAIAFGLAFLEAFGALLLICGLLNIRIF